MATTLEQYGTGGGIAIGAGVGAAAASFSGITADFAVVTSFGVIGGLVVGGFAGRFTETNSDHDNWRSRVVAYTLFVSLLTGLLLGLLTAWMVDGSLVNGALGGAGTGSVFSLLMSWMLIAARRKEKQSHSTVQPE